MKKLYLFLFLLLAVFLCTSNETHAQWEQVALPNRATVQALVSVGTNIFAGFNGYSSNYGGIYRSTDNGDTWSAADSGLVKNDGDTVNILHLTAMGNTIIAGTDSEGIFISTNNGDSWTQSNKGIEAIRDSNNQETNITTIDTNDSKIYTAADWVGVFVSSDTGKIWKSINNGFRLNYLGNPADRIYAFGFIGKNIYAFSDFGMYFSTNDGSSWMVDSLIHRGKSYTTLDDVMYWGDPGGISRSTDLGETWTYVNAPYDTIAGTVNIETLIGYNKKLIAGSDYGVYISSDSGATWHSLNTGWKKFQPVIVYSLITSNNYLFAGTNGYGIWRIPLSQIITSVKNPTQTLPDNYFLQQNYPNPFNPSTIINYQLPGSGLVTIKIYDMLGRLVRTLVDEKKPAGNYLVQFNGDRLATGVYFYQLRVVSEDRLTGNFIQTRKMVLMK